MNTFMPDYKDEAELKAAQLAGLKWSVAHAYEGSTFYRERFDGAGVTPGMIESLEDIRRLPFTAASDLKEGYPYPLRSVPFQDIVRIHSSSGTTGKRKVLCYTQKDLDDWAHFFARCYEFAGVTPADRVQIAVGYGLWTAGAGFQAGVEALGALAVPVGPGNLDMQCEFLVDMESTVVCCTASMALLLGEEVLRRGLRDKVRVKSVIMGSERCSDAMRRKIMENLGVEHVYDITGMTELYGPGAGIDCPLHEGIHYWADCYIMEILDPDTLEPVPEGEVGEMVVTTLMKEGAPLIRYRTRDLTRFIPGRCGCGSILPRHDRIMGRSDDMFIFRAVNIYPSQIDSLLSGARGVGSEYRVVLDAREDGKDYMTIEIERDESGNPAEDKALCKEIEHLIKSHIMVSAAINVVDFGSLPRTERKSKRVFDNRLQD